MAFLGESTLTRRRYAAGSIGADGRWTEGVTTDATFRGSVQPLSGKDMAILSEGLRAKVTRKVYAPRGTLRTVDQHDGDRSDRVVDGDGLVYEVVHVDDAHPLIPHDRAYLTRVQEGA